MTRWAWLASIPNVFRVKCSISQVQQLIQERLRRQRPAANRRKFLCLSGGAAAAIVGEAISTSLPGPVAAAVPSSVAASSTRECEGG